MSEGKKSWGHCMNCKHFGSPADMPLPGEEARCKHPVLERYELNVFGACGCSGFELRAGVPASAEKPSPHVTL